VISNENSKNINKISTMVHFVEVYLTISLCFF
jgi:hypothetical protein